MIRLRHLVQIGPSAAETRRLDANDAVTFVPMEAISDGLGGLDTSAERSLSDVTSGSYNYFADGDILLAKVTPCFENGKKALAKRLTNGCGFATSEVHVLRPDTTKIDSRFLLYLLSSEDFRAGGMASMTGAGGLRRVSEDGVLNYRPRVTDLDAQKTIAAFLDRETARIDQLIEKKGRFQKLADDRWRAVLDAAILGREPNIADNLTWTPLGRLVQDYRRIMYGIVLPGPDVEVGVPIVKGGDVKPERLKRDRLCKTTYEIEAKFERARLRAGDLVIAIRGGVGDIEIVPDDVEGANITQDVARIAPKDDVDRTWLRYALMAPTVFAPLEARMLGAAVRGINIFDLKKVMVPTPPTAVQTELAHVLDSKARELQRLNDAVRRHKALMVEFRAALITAAVTGQIDVTTWGKHGTTDRRVDQIEEDISLEVDA